MEIGNKNIPHATYYYTNNSTGHGFNISGQLAVHSVFLLLFRLKLFCLSHPTKTEPRYIWYPTDIISR